MLTVTYDNSDKDVPGICVMKVGENLKCACLKVELGEQAKLLYRALTEQGFKIREKNDSIKIITNAEEAEAYPISENISKGFEEFTKMMFKQGQAESEGKE